jgi:hypothetical protein
VVADPTVEQLQSVLTDRHDRLAALPEVLGWGVGVGADGQPIIQLFVSAAPSDDLVAEFGGLFDRFEVVVQSRRAEAV